MRNLLFIGLGVALAITENLFDNWLPFEYLTPDLVLPFILYMGLIGINASRGAAISFAIGYFVDTLQPGSPICLNMFVFVCVFLSSRILAARFLLAGTVFHISLTFMGSVVSSLIMIGLRAIFERHVGGLTPLALLVLARAISTSVASPFVFSLAKRIDTKRVQRREERILH